MNEIHVRVGDTVADAISNLPTVRVGETVQLELRFRENDMANVFSTPAERHGELMQLIRWANDATVTVDRSSSGVSNYREEVPARAAVESFVVPVEFGDGITRIPDFWGVVTGGEDTRGSGSGRVSLRLDVAVLAFGDEYRSRSELAADLSAQVV